MYMHVCIHSHLPTCVQSTSTHKNFLTRMISTIFLSNPTKHKKTSFFLSLSLPFSLSLSLSLSVCLSIFF